MRIEKSWHEKLKNEIEQPYIQELKNFLEREKHEGKIVYPPEPLVFNSFLQTPFDKVKAVVVGQDPYHGAGQAHGLSFSVPKGVSPPPSLKNIFKELQSDVGIPTPPHGCLTSWAEQGVLLLNATLTVRAGEPKSHWGKGWERFTDAVIDTLAKRPDPIVFLLWGKSAQEKFKACKVMQHSVLTAAHPSPFSAYRGFLGCRHFSKINEILKRWNKDPIIWDLP